MAEEALSNATVAQHHHCDDEDQHTQDARPSLEEEGQEVETHHHHLVLENEGTRRLGDQQNWEHPVETVHDAGEREGCSGD